MRIKNFGLSYGTQLFKAFSEPARVRILHLMYQNKAMCISDLELTLDYTQTKTSRHISYLRHAGLLSSQRKEPYMFYMIKDEVAEIIGQLMQYMLKDPTLLKDQEVYRILYSNRELAVNRLETRQWKPYTP